MYFFHCGIFLNFHGLFLLRCFHLNRDFLGLKLLKMNYHILLLPLQAHLLDDGDLVLLAVRHFVRVVYRELLDVAGSASC